MMNSPGDEPAYDEPSYDEQSPWWAVWVMNPSYDEPSVLIRPGMKR